MSATACGNGVRMLRQPRLRVRQAVERERLQPLVCARFARLGHFVETLHATPHVGLLEVTKADPILDQQGFAQIALPAKDRLSLPKFGDCLTEVGIIEALVGLFKQTAGLNQYPGARRRRREVYMREVRDVLVAAFAFCQGAQIAQRLPPCQRILRPPLLGERERLVNQSGGYTVTKKKVAAAEDAPDPFIIAGLMRLLKSGEKFIFSFRYSFIPLFDQPEIAPGLIGPGRGRVLFQVIIPVFFSLEELSQVLAQEGAIEERFEKRAVQFNRAVEMFETAIERSRVSPRFPQSFEVALLHQRRAQIAVNPGVIGRGFKRRFKFRDRILEILARQMESPHRVMRCGGCPCRNCRLIFPDRVVQQIKGAAASREINVRLPAVRIRSSARFAERGVLQLRNPRLDQTPLAIGLVERDHAFFQSRVDYALPIALPQTPYSKPNPDSERRTGGDLPS